VTTEDGAKGEDVHFYELAVVLLTVVAIGVLAIVGTTLITENGAPAPAKVQER